MDLNVLVIAGTLAAPPEIRKFDSGSERAKFLVVVRSDEPRRRVDVVPVIFWNEDHDYEFDDLIPRMERGSRIWIAANIQRRFWSTTEGRQSRLEVVAHHIQAIGENNQAIDEPMTEEAR